MDFSNRGTKAPGVFLLLAERIADIFARAPADLSDQHRLDCHEVLIHVRKPRGKQRGFVSKSRKLEHFVSRRTRIEGK